MDSYIHGLSRRYDGSHHHECDLLWTCLYEHVTSTMKQQCNSLIFNLIFISNYYCSWTTKTLLMVESRGMTSGCTASAASHMTCTNFNFIHIFVLSGSFQKLPYYKFMKNALSWSSRSFSVCRMANNSCSTGSTFRLRSLASNCRYLYLIEDICKCWLSVKTACHTVALCSVVFRSYTA